MKRGRSRFLNLIGIFYLLNMEYINLELPKEDAAVLLQCLNVAKSKKKAEAVQCLRRNQLESYGNKFLLIQKISEISEHIEYLIKKN